MVSRAAGSNVARSKPRLQILAIDVFHRQKIAAAGKLAEAKRADNVRMIEAGKNRGFLDELFNGRAASLPRFEQGFHGHDVS